MIGPKVTGVPNGVGDSVVLDFLMLTLVGQVERGGCQGNKFGKRWPATNVR